MASHYTDQTSIQAYIYPNSLNQALADNADGSAVTGLLDQIIQEVGMAIDGRVANIYAVPFPDWTGNPSNPGCPAIVHSVATMLTCEAVYDRRTAGMSADEDLNPFRSRANSSRKQLEAIGNGEYHLDLRFARAFYQGQAILEEAKVNNSTLGI